jgi:hypothetical protein
LEDDKKVAKRLASWEPDEEVVAPKLFTLSNTMDENNSKKIRVVQDMLFQTCRGFMNDLEDCNINDATCNMCFAALLIHLESILHVNPTSAIAMKVTNACKAASCDLEVLLSAGRLLRIDSTFPKSNCSTAREKSLEVKVERLESKLDRCSSELSILRKQNDTMISLLRSYTTSKSSILTPGSDMRINGGSSQYIDTSTNVVLRIEVDFNAPIRSFVYQWYTIEPWKLARQSKKEQNLFCEYTSCIAILKITFNEAINIPAKPTENTSEFNHWKNDILHFSKSMENNFNNIMHRIDGRNNTLKASGVRNRFERCKPQNEDFANMVKTFASLRVDNLILDNVTPWKHQKEGKKLANYKFLLQRIRVNSIECE